MNESLIQQYYLNEDGFFSCKILLLIMIMTLVNDFKSWLILVPAAAVIREGQALSIMTGRKESADCRVS